MLPIKALLFDVFGTVVDWRGGLIAQLEAWGTAHGVDADWPGLADAWRGAYISSVRQVRTGARPWTDFDALQRESVEQLAAQFGATTLEAADFDAFVRMWHELPPWAVRCRVSRSCAAST